MLVHMGGGLRHAPLQLFSPLRDLPSRCPKALPCACLSAYTNLRLQCRVVDGAETRSSNTFHNEPITSHLINLNALAPPGFSWQLLLTASSYKKSGLEDVDKRCTKASVSRLASSRHSAFGLSLLACSLVFVLSRSASGPIHTELSSAIWSQQME